jgi:energy-coupling factor transport system permease protein
MSRKSGDRVIHSQHAGGHPLAWTLWLGSAMLAVLLTSNPLYHATIALCALVVYAGVRPRRSGALDVLLSLGLMFCLLSVPLNLLTGSSGTTELFSLPAMTLPGWLGSVTVGGPVTAESLVYAADEALALAAILSIVCAFNAGVDHGQLLRLTPPGLAQLGLVVAVGLLLVPEALARAASLREARMTRGLASGWTASHTMLLPLLSDALERAVQRAESLDARGFGALASPVRTGETAVSILGLVLATIGAFAWYYAPDERGVAGSMFLAGAALVLTMAWQQASRGTARRLFVPKLRRNDVLTAAASACSAATFLAMRLAGAGDVTYLPFPVLHAASYSIALGCASLLLLAPLVAGANT